jgi:recombination DNA repair RAD52 pathway protein
MVRLLNPVREDRIEVKQGLSYVPQQEVRAELNRTFGMGNWDSQVIHMELAYENTQPGTGKNADKTYWICGYAAAVRLRVRNYEGEPIAEFIEYHFEENAPQPNRGEARVLAMTSAASYALRRAAIGLGDAFGLHLYDRGNLNPIVRGTLALTDKDSPTYKEPQKPAGAPRNPALVQEGQAPQNAPESPVPAPASGISELAEGFNHPEARQS